MPKLPTKTKPLTPQDDGLVSAIGIDPGEHVGVAIGWYAPDKPGSWEVAHTYEMTPLVFRDWFIDRLNGGPSSKPDIVSCEDFQLYADKAKELTGSKLETVRLLGWIEYTVEQLNRFFGKNAMESCMIDWISCPASVQRVHGSQAKSPTAGAMRALGIPFVSPPGANKSRGSTGEHQRSAELHLWAGLMKLGLVPGVR